MSERWFRGRRVLVGDVPAPAALRVVGEQITAVLAYDAVPPGAEVIDAGERLLTPGVVDTHVHLNEPGRTEWEGFTTATRAAAAGGITTVVDMPLNCIPATTTRRAAEVKREAADGQLQIDVAFWGGVIPGNAGDLAELAAFGVPGAKCFLCPSGVDEFPNVTRADLELALPVLRDHGRTLLVHAELPGPLEAAEAGLAGLDARAYETYLRSRPPSAEDEAVALVIELARRFQAPAHIVHLSSASALPMIARAQDEGVPITAETCLHYLTFTAEEIAAGATHFKCAPPIRGRENRERLWRGLREGVLSMVVSDHSPCTPALKRPDTGDFLGAWGGIAGLQLGLSGLHTEASRRGIPLRTMGDWNTRRTAALAGLGARKGRLAAGFGADLVIWDDRQRFTVEPAGILHRHGLTPYAGRAHDGVVHQTWLRGALVFDAAGAPVARAPGRVLTVHP